MRPKTLTLGTRMVGEGQPCFVLAEVASAHGGSADTALKMLESAFKMGADGGATARIAALLRDTAARAETAGTGSMVG